MNDVSIDMSEEATILPKMSWPSFFKLSMTWTPNLNFEQGEWVKAPSANQYGDTMTFLLQAESYSPAHHYPQYVQVVLIKRDGVTYLVPTFGISFQWTHSFDIYMKTWKHKWEPRPGKTYTMVYERNNLSSSGYLHFMLYENDVDSGESTLIFTRGYSWGSFTGRAPPNYVLKVGNVYGSQPSIGTIHNFKMEEKPTIRDQNVYVSYALCRFGGHFRQWGECSATCAGGTQQRVRLFDEAVETQACNEQPCGQAPTPTPPIETGKDGVCTGPDCTGVCMDVAAGEPMYTQMPRGVIGFMPYPTTTEPWKLTFSFRNKVTANWPNHGYRAKRETLLEARGHGFDHVISDQIDNNNHNLHLLWLTSPGGSHSASPWGGYSDIVMDYSTEAEWKIVVKYYIFKSELTVYKNGVLHGHKSKVTKWNPPSIAKWGEKGGVSEITVHAPADMHNPKCAGSADWPACGDRGYDAKFNHNLGTITSLIFEAPGCNGGHTWSAWSTCTKSCGTGGVQKRTKKYGSEISEETQGCNEQACPEWTDWSAWSACDASCAGGVQTSTRTKEDEEPQTKTQSCNEHACPAWTAWSPWTACDKSCDGGHQTSTRTKDDEAPQTKTQACNEQSCPTWSGWGEWESCDKTCGGGVQKRYNYKDDEETQVQTQECNTQTCHTVCPHKEMHLIPETEPCLPEYALNHSGYKRCWSRELYRLCLTDYSYKFRKCRRLRKKYGPFKDLDDELANGTRRRRSELTPRRKQKDGKCYKYCEGLDTFDTLNKCVKDNKKWAKKNARKINQGKLPPLDL